MPLTIEELDYRRTPLGELILRRRRSLDGTEIYEVKLNDRLLMSSLVNASEIALARLALGDFRFVHQARHQEAVVEFDLVYFGAVQ